LSGENVYMLASTAVLFGAFTYFYSKNFGMELNFCI